MEWDDAAQAFTNKLSAADFFALVAKEPSGYLYCDGGTNNRRIEHQLGAVGAIAGNDLTEADYEFDVPTVASDYVIWQWSDSIANPWVPTALNLSCWIQSGSSDLLITAQSNGAANARQFKYAGFRAAFAGKRVRLTVAFTGGSTTNPTVWLNGVDISASFALTTLGAPPNWTDATLATTYHLQGFNWPAGFFRPGRALNRKFVQADVDFVTINRRLTAPDQLGGSQVLAYSEDFSAVNGWNVAGTASIAGGVANFPANNDNIYKGGLFPRRMSAQIRLRFDYATTAPGTFRISGYFHVPSFGPTNLDVALAGNGTFDAIYSITQNHPTDTGLEFVSLGWTGTIDNIKVNFVGALFEPVIQPVLVLDDATRNNKAGLLVGYTHSTSKKDWRIPAFVDRSSTGNKQLLSGAVFSDPAQHAIDTIEVENAGTPTSSIGDGTTATRYSASTAYAAGRTRVAVANNFPADSAKTGLYENVTVASASDASGLVIIRGHSK